MTPEQNLSRFKIYSRRVENFGTVSEEGASSRLVEPPSGPGASLLAQIHDGFSAKDSYDPVVGLGGSLFFCQ